MKNFSWLLIMFFLSSCATIVHGPLQKFVITSDPRTASIYIDGKHYGNTPKVARMSRRRSHTLRLELEGYQPYELVLKRKMDGWMYGNILVGGLPGIAIDFLTGSIFRLTPKDIYPTMQASVSGKKQYGLAIVVTMQAKPEWEKIGVLGAMVP
jgi:hypothetical protein